MNLTELCRDQWLQTVSPDEPHKLQRRLDWENLDWDDFYSQLSKQPKFIYGDESIWETALKRAINCLSDHWSIGLLDTKEYDDMPFVDVWWPIAVDIKMQLQNKFGVQNTLISPSIFEQLSHYLLKRLCSLGDQVLWEEFTKGRSAGAILLAHLGSSGDGNGPPTREHYESFVQKHRREGLASILEEYPVLRRLIGSVIALWQQGSEEMIQRIINDRDVIEQVFQISKLDQLIAVKQGLSDPHRGGRAVSVLTFEGKTGLRKKIVYKPKDMRLDSIYQQALADINSHSKLKSLRTLSIYPGNGYGYMEFVEHKICQDIKELKAFYTNAGRLTAVLNLLGCTDCHYENLIASEDQLILIDTETLLEADLPDHISDSRSQTESSEPSNLNKRFQGSVLRSGLLPQWMFAGDGKFAFDISALGIAPPKEATTQTTGWLGINSDGMMPGKIKTNVELQTSLPVGIGATNVFDRYLDDFCNGFSIQCDEIRLIKDRWLKPNSILYQFAGLPRRIVLRATRVYFAIQRQQLEPSSLRSSWSQALKLEQLTRSFLMAEEKPLHWPIYAAESSQMQHLDIPFFTHLIDSSSLVLDHNNSTLANFIKKSGLQAALDRLKNLNSEEILFQLRLIRGASEARNLGTSLNSTLDADALLPSNSQAEPLETTINQAVLSIVQHILDSAICDSNGHIEWLGMDLGADGESFSFGPVGISLYGGSIGIFSLLRCLEKKQICLDRTVDVQSSILKPLKEIVSSTSSDQLRRWWRDQSLGLSGCGGILLTLALHHEYELGEQLIDGALTRYINSDQQMDVIGGCTGLIGSLLQYGSKKSQELAYRSGEHLVTNQADSGGWSKTSNQKALLGFSHGTAGFAAALARLNVATGEKKFKLAAEKALTYERSHFNLEEKNWPDFRIFNSKSDDAPTFMTSWCHGAPGIALGRACLWGTELWDEQCIEEISIATQTTLSMKTLKMDHLCCGTLGLMVILEIIASGPWPLDPTLRQQCQQSANHYRKLAIARCQTDKLDLRCFTTSEGTLMLPGFYTGLSGMAHSLLHDKFSKSIVFQLISSGLLVTD